MVVVMHDPAHLSQQLNQQVMPIVEALGHYQGVQAPFYTPGHKRGQGIPATLRDRWGAAAFAYDLPELPGLDNLLDPQGVIQVAQTLAAEAFGAEQTWFLANGSTAGLLAAILTVCAAGEKIILPRNVHRSVISGLILAGAMPIFVQPEYDADWDLVQGVDPVTIALALNQHPDAKAVLVVSPTYHGVCSDLQMIAHLTHQANLPLLVDEAHGAHFAFHPELPPSALNCGADLVVQSTHKTLSALTQAAMMHVQGDRLDRQRLSQSLALVQSTSPNYLLLASLDAARQQMALQGDELMAQTLDLASQARANLTQLEPIAVLQPEAAGDPGFAHLDRTRLTVRVDQVGITGFEADERLLQDFAVLAELPALRHLTFIISLGNTASDIDRLGQGLAALRHLNLKPMPPFQPRWLLPTLLSPVMVPREAFFAAHRTVPIAQAVGHICAELICPYPPGIPLLMPGEEVTLGAIEALQEVQAAGGEITGCADANLAHLRVIA